MTPKLCLFTSLLIAGAFACSASSWAAQKLEPAEKYNNMGVGHGLEYIQLKQDTSLLRAGNYGKLGLRTKGRIPPPECLNMPCLRIQTLEKVKTPRGVTYFSWGWGGPQGQSGHISLGDLAKIPPISPKLRAGNGKPAPSFHLRDSKKVKSYRVQPQPIEEDMTYIGPGDHQVHTFRPYGQPGGKYGARDYTNISWSWTNVEGGGVVRAMIKRGQVFYPSAVKSIKVNAMGGKGWIRVIYGYMSTGKQKLYGWLVHSHQYAGKPVVYHVVCDKC